MRGGYTEAEVQKAIVGAARATGWHVTIFSTDRQGRRQHRSVPDLYLTHQGQQRQIWIECKAHGKWARDDQIEWINRVNQAGGEAYICDSLETAWAHLQKRRKGDR